MKKVSSTSKILNLRSPLPLSLFAFQAPELDAPVQHPLPDDDHIDDDDIIDDDNIIDDDDIIDDDVKTTASDVIDDDDVKATAGYDLIDH